MVFLIKKNIFALDWVNPQALANPPVTSQTTPEDNARIPRQRGDRRTMPLSPSNLRLSRVYEVAVGSRLRREATRLLAVLLFGSSSWAFS